MHRPAHENTKNSRAHIDFAQIHEMSSTETSEEIARRDYTRTRAHKTEQHKHENKQKETLPDLSHPIRDFLGVRGLAKTN